MEKEIRAQRRVYLGNIIGNRILSDYNKIVVVTQDNLLNNILSASIESSYLDASLSRFINVIVSRDNESRAVEKITSFSPEAIVFVFGGENREETVDLLKSLLSKLYAAECHADLFFETVNFEKEILEKTISLENVLRFLEENNSYAITIDPDEGVVMLNEIVINKDKKIELYTLSEYPITFDHGKLLKNSS